MTTLRRCIEFLNRYQVPYIHSRHANAYRAREVSWAEHVPPYMLAKTVIFCADGCYAMAVLPADCLVDFEELAENIGVASTRLATEGELTRLFPECEVGAMPPLGALFNLPVYVDRRLTEEEYVVFNAGTHRDAIHMRFEDFARIADPLIVRFAHPEPVGVY